MVPTLRFSVDWRLPNDIKLINICLEIFAFVEIPRIQRVDKPRYSVGPFLTPTIWLKWLSMLLIIHTNFCYVVY